jgi:hypothetical protein
MRVKIMRLLAVVLIGLCGVAAATPIVYTVFVSDAFETFSGTITTDGTLGSLGAGNFTGFSLLGSGDINFGPLTPGSVECAISGCGVFATATELTFVDVSGTKQIDFAATHCEFFAFRADMIELLIGCFPHHIISVGTPYTFGRVTVPEPSTVTLLGLALAALGFSRRRKSN